MKKINTIILTALIGTASASAQYALPAGGFYRGWIAGAGNFGKALKGTEILIPSGAEMVWLADDIKNADGSVVDDASAYQWSYSTYENGWKTVTIQGQKLTTPAILSSYDSFDAPSLNGVKMADKVRNAGDSHVSEFAVQYSPADMNKAQAGITGDGSYELVYQPSLSLPNDFYYQPASANQATFKPAALGFVINQPTAPYGVKGIVWTGRFDGYGYDNNLQSLNGHIYRINEDNTLGDEIASCKVGREDLKTFADEKGYATIPMYFPDGYVNITEKVAVMIDGFWNSQAVTGAVLSSDPSMKISSNAVYLANGKLCYWKDIRLNGTRDNNWLAPDLYLHSYTVGLLLQNEVIVTPEETKKLETHFELTGGTKEIELTPSIDLKNTGLTNSTEWFTVTIGDRDAATKKQKITITANEYAAETPASRASNYQTRSGKFTITAPGNVTTFTVEQGNVPTGLETVTADIPVSSEYFDLYGRKLSSKPESGLCIRRDNFANGTSKAVKVIVR